MADFVLAQDNKLAEISEILLAAGYFRARITTLKPFDKILGGMAWCITASNVDVDIDFSEDLTLGQKTKLGENIVNALRKMKCPHPLQAHQIQGLDYDKLFPIVQWLVKRVLATREEMGDTIRQHSEAQFKKHYGLFDKKPEITTEFLQSVLKRYQATRQLRRVQILPTEAMRINSVFVEFGEKVLYLSPDGYNQETAQAASADLLRQQQEAEAERQKGEQQRLERTMAAVGSVGISGSRVGSLVALRSDEITRATNEYQEQQSEDMLAVTNVINQQHQHTRQVGLLRKQLASRQEQLNQLRNVYNGLMESLEEAQTTLSRGVNRSATLREQCEKANEMQQSVSTDQAKLDQLHELVQLNETLKQQEVQFKGQCRSQLSQLQETLNQIDNELSPEEQAKWAEIETAYEKETVKYDKMRNLLGQKNQAIALLQISIEEIPTRAELQQYQRRFVELYDQVAANHEENRKYFASYNTLDESRKLLNKQVSLLNSIHDTFTKGFGSKSQKENFLRSFQDIVSGVKGSLEKVEEKLSKLKAQQDSLQEQSRLQMDRQRKYVKLIQDLQEECAKNETLATAV
eukprot:GILJ01002421.1.p1 GENE.GILJ01002421.1~~GILJ01002421.1.p1  ORF type:complete len:576 (-),score=138.77 GILJ01002421.1:203-1930(-)